MKPLEHLRSVIAPFVVLGAVAACTAPEEGSPFTPVAPVGPDSGTTLADASPPPPVARLTTVPPYDAGIGAYDPEPVCPDVLSLGAGDRLAASTTNDDFGLSVTADERTAAWMTEQAGEVTIHYVDRATAAEPFGAARSVSGAFDAGRVALASTGLEIAVVDAGGLGFSVLRRTARSDAFGAPEVGPFEVLDAVGVEDLAPAGERYADPLYANGDAYFIHSRVRADGAGAVQVSSRFFGTAPFSPGVPFAEEALASVGAKRKSVTGASADVRTLFVWDEGTAKSHVVRLSARGEIESTTALGSARDVQPTADCRVFWFTRGAPADVLRYAAP